MTHYLIFSIHSVCCFDTNIIQLALFAESEKLHVYTLVFKCVEFLDSPTGSLLCF